MTEPVPIPTDRQLIAATRDGSDSAFGELSARHRSAVAGVARAVYGRHGDAVVGDVFDRFRSELSAPDRVADDASPAPALRAVRPWVLSLVNPDPQPRPPGPPGVDAAMLLSIDAAYRRLSAPWQTVLWHRLVDDEPAASMTAALGRSPADVVALGAAAERGLFETYLDVELETPGRVEPACRAVVPLLGAYERGTLGAAQRRTVGAHLGTAGSADGAADTGCESCRQRLRVMTALGVVVPLALVPAITGLSVATYRTAVGVAVPLGASALSAQRSERANRRARVAAVLVIALALLGAAFLIRSPFADLDGQISDLIENASTTLPGEPGSPGDTTPGDGSALPSRIELVFPGVPQGVTYVPGGPSLSLGLSLSSPAPVYRGGTGTIDASLTNLTSTPADVEFDVRASRGVSFAKATEGTVTCERNGPGATCRLSLAAGATEPLSLRFAFDATVSDRLVVAPSIRSDVLELPIVTVPGLLTGLVGRGELVVAGAAFDSCAAVDGCTSAATLTLPPDVGIDDALLVWSTVGSPSSDGVGFAAPGSSVVEPITNPTTVTTDDGSRSSADVTAQVSSSGAGTYGVVRPRGASAGSWTLLVVTRRADAPRRLVVALDPLRPVGPDAPLSLGVPITSPAAGPPRSPLRPTVLQTFASDAAPISLAVNGRTLTGTPVGESGLTYAADIDANAETLDLDIMSPARPTRIAVIGFAIDIVT